MSDDPPPTTTTTQPPPQSPTRRSRPTPTVNSIFNLRKPTSNKNVILNETNLISLFYHTDRKLYKAIKSLKTYEDGLSPDLRGRTNRTLQRRNEKVHRYQRMLLETVNLVYLEMDEDMKSDRTYRNDLPQEDQRELEIGYSENILFAAQALSKGFRIRGIESFTPVLKEDASFLIAAFDALLHVFRNDKSNLLDNNVLYKVVSSFDKSWTSFESKICICYFQVTYQTTSNFKSTRLHTDLFLCLLSETVLGSLKKGLITKGQLDDFSPKVIFAIPRLAVFNGLIQKSRETLLENDGGKREEVGQGLGVKKKNNVCIWSEEDGFYVFKKNQNEIKNLTKKLGILSVDEADSVERLVGGGSSLGEDVEGVVRECYLEVCRIADDLQSGSFAKEFVSIMQQVFIMHSEDEK